MNPSDSSDLEHQRKELSGNVYSLLEDVSPEEAVQLQALQSPRDLPLADTLSALFQKTAVGREEALRMEIDILRRLSRSEETEQIFRPYGVLEVVTPVRIRGETCFAICSGPLLVEAWTQPAKDTLAKICGVRNKDLPGNLEKASLYTADQIRVIAGYQNQLAEWVTTAFSRTASESEPATASLEAGALDILQPGFADHLDVLFGLIQQGTPKERDLPASEVERIHKIAERGRTLTEHARRLRDHAVGEAKPLSVHAALSTWCKKLESQHPHLRIRTRLEAEEDMVMANEHQLHHLIYTLLSGTVDGLPEGRALLGVSTRNEGREGRDVLHLEVRDGGGMATFAGVGGELDRELEQENLQVSDEGAEWTTLASRLNAEIRILRDADAVTRAEVFLPLAGGADGDMTETGTQQLWIVENEDQEVENLLRMLQTLPVSCTRFRSAAELKEKFATATTAPDMVLLKYYLPDERGADVRSWIYEQDPSLPVILISSLEATHPGIATVNRLPSTLYLQKPFDASALLDMIHLNLDDTLAG